LELADIVAFFRTQRIKIGDYEQDYQFLYTANDIRMGVDEWLGFNVVSKDEIYQKYSITIALWASVISIIISTVGILLQLFIPQNIIVELPENLTTLCFIQVIKFILL